MNDQESKPEEMDNDQEVAAENDLSSDYPQVDLQILRRYAAKELDDNQSRLISQLIVRFKEWANAYKNVLKESAPKNND